MKYIAVTGVALALAAHTSAQVELVIFIDEVSLGSWVATGELLNPTGVVLAAMSDFSFHMEGANISNFVYNDAFDSEFFGPATAMVTPTAVDFIGLNAGGPLANVGGPDSSNPQFLASFDADTLSSFDLTGQNSGYYESGGDFPIVFFYQDVFGAPGTVPFRIEINPIPAPASVAVVVMGGVVVVRRRR